MVQVNKREHLCKCFTLESYFNEWLTVTIEKSGLHTHLYTLFGPSNVFLYYSITENVCKVVCLMYVW